MKKVIGIGIVLLSVLVMAACSGSNVSGPAATAIYNAQNAASTAVAGLKQAVTPISGIPAAPTIGALFPAAPTAASEFNQQTAPTLGAEVSQPFNTPAPTVPAALQPSPAPGSNTGQAGIPSTGIDPSALQAEQTIFESVYAKINPSVVNISVLTTTAGNSQGNSPFGFPPGFGNNAPSQVSQALGSGFIWDNQGHIVTNNHVVEGATDITVTLSDGRSFTAKVVGRDPQSDLAVIQVNTTGGGFPPPVVMADYTKIRVGQIAIAIGNPFGLSGTMTQGIVSALGRSLPVTSDTSGQGSGGSNGFGGSTGPTYTIPDIIQTDAPINPGNSGGVLVNAAGEVMGVTSALASSSNSNSGIGFVIPSNIVQKVVPALIQTGKFQHPYLGISGTDMVPELAQAMNLNPQQTGVLLADVTPGGPAANAGLQGSTHQVDINGQTALVGGDIVTAIDGHQIKSMDDLISYLTDNTQVGQTITLSVIRNGKQGSVQVKLAARPDNTQQQGLTQP